MVLPSASVSSESDFLKIGDSITSRRKIDFAFLVRHLDPDERFAGNAVDADRRRLEREAKIIDQPRNARIFNARVGLEFVRRNYRPGSDMHDLAGTLNSAVFLFEQSSRFRAVPIPYG